MLRTFRTVLWALAIAAAIATAGAYLFRWYAAHREAEWALELDGRPAPAFALTDQTGRTVKLDDLTGHVTVVTFVYTSCPDTCPLTLRRLVAVRQRLPAELRDRVRIVAVTVDPERDTVARIGQYAVANGFQDVLFLTGDRRSLEPVWAGFAVAAERSGGTGNSYEVLHTAVTYVLDREGRLVFLVRDEALEPERFATLLERLLTS
ncbi:MAG: SCO family protein [Thermomicrobium sp.]|nr:SCO family protein [Thermomicrobium sp.]